MNFWIWLCQVLLSSMKKWPFTFKKKFCIRLQFIFESKQSMQSIDYKNDRWATLKVTRCFTLLKLDTRITLRGVTRKLSLESTPLFTKISISFHKILMCRAFLTDGITVPKSFLFITTGCGSQIENKCNNRVNNLFNFQLQPPYFLKYV